LVPAQSCIATKAIGAKLAPRKLAGAMSAM